MSQGVKRGVRGVPRVKGGGIQVSQGVMRGFRGKGKSRGSKGLKGTLWVYQGSRERHSDMIHFMREKKHIFVKSNENSIIPT